MKLLQQPEDGIRPLLQAIHTAQSSIDILIFRFDQPEIEKALAEAVARGISVQALIAHVNGSGEESLRKLEARLLGAGITVARTGDAFVRYHAKLMVIDRAELYLLAFNFTRLDINRSRSFGVVLKDPKVVKEALKLMEADTKRQPYQAGLPSFVVSPENARPQLAAFLQGAQHELLIYDPKINDGSMIRLLQERIKADVEVRVIGHTAPAAGIATRKLVSPRLHTRAIVRDRLDVFIGSQSLRELELDRRREAGIILHEPAIVNQVLKTFLEDWELSKPSKEQDAVPVAPPSVLKVAKKVAKVVVKELPPVAPVLEVTMKELLADRPGLELDAEDVEETVRDAVKNAVKSVLQDVVEEAEHN